MSLTKIEWATYTFNPWIGCTKIAPGCKFCYAEADMDKRRGRAQWGSSGTRSRTSAAYWKQPATWNRKAAKAIDRPRVFCGSLCDVFEDWSGAIVDSKGESRAESMQDLRQGIYELARATPNLDWLLLTKRPDNAREFWPGRLDNVWLGCSVSEQATADQSRDAMEQSAGLFAKRFVSYEPALGNVDWSDWLHFIDWIIAGGESGPNARGCEADWIRSAVQQCTAAGVPVFVKQLGARPIGANVSHAKGGDLAEWPADLQVRQLVKANA